MSAGRYLAETRGAFEIDAAPTTEAPAAPFEETAVQHMTTERMIAFIRWMENLAD